MSKKSLVTIVIPFYNAKKFISQAIRNVASQTYENLEVVFVDDGSTDGGEKKVASASRKDKRIMLIRQKNQFAGTARNRGLDVARGKYITFWDVDDVVDPTYIEKMLAIIELKKADIAVCNCQGIDDETGIVHDNLVQLLDRKKRPRKKAFSWNDIPDRIFQLSNCWVWDKLYRTDFVREKAIRFQGTRVLNDAYFCCVANVSASRITVCDEILVTHRTSVSTSLESTSDAHWKCAYELLFAIRDKLDEMGILDKVQRSYINLSANIISYYVACNRNQKCFLEAYEDYHCEKEKLFRFSEYSSELFYSEFIIDQLKSYENDDKFSFLFQRLQIVEKEKKQEQLFVKALEGHTRLLEKYNEDLSNYCHNLEEEMRSIVEMLRNKSWPLPTLPAEKGAKLAVYGYGDVGKDFCRQIASDKYYELVVAVDKNYEALCEESVKIVSPEQLKDYKYDYLLIAVLKAETADQIKDDMIKRGVDSKKIIWADLLKKGE